MTGEGRDVVEDMNAGTVVSTGERYENGRVMVFTIHDGMAVWFGHFCDLGDIEVAMREARVVASETYG